VSPALVAIYARKAVVAHAESRRYTFTSGVPESEIVRTGDAYIAAYSKLLDECGGDEGAARDAFLRACSPAPFIFVLQ
jgi:hypothetical protein